MKRSILCIVLMFVFIALAVLAYVAVSQFTPLKDEAYLVDGRDPSAFMQGFKTMVLSMIAAVSFVSLLFFAVEEWGMKRGSIARLIIQLGIDVVFLAMALIYAILKLQCYPTTAVNIPLWVYGFPIVLWAFLVFTTVCVLPPHTRAGLFRKVALI